MGARKRKEVEDAERCIMRSFVICTPCYAAGEIISRIWREKAFCLANLKEPLRRLRIEWEVKIKIDK
jgi:hypothetical protein